MNGNYLARLTNKERELLIMAAEYLLAGEWPLEDDPQEQQELDREILSRASEKLKDQLASRKRR